MEEQIEHEEAFPRLSPDLLAVVERAGERRRLAKGQVLNRAGEVSNEFFVVLEGTLAAYQDYGGARERLMVLLGARRFIGELNLITGQPAYVTIVAPEDGEAIVLSIDALRAVISANQRIGDLILGAFVIRRSLLIGLGAGLQLVGSPYTPDTRRLREFLTRNRIPHGFLDVETDEDADRLLREFDVAPAETPLLLRGSLALRNPSNSEVAQALHLRPPRASSRVWDTLAVGAGPAGLGAAVYGASEGLSTVLMDSVAVGGQASTSARIENYLGFPAGISGTDLAERAAVQAKRFGAASAVPVTATGLAYEDGYHVVELEAGERLRGRTVVVATGARYRRLNVARLSEFEGTGVYYTATEVEAQACEGAPVVVVGGANSAGQGAVFLAGRGSRVELVVRGENLGASMSRYLVDQVRAHPDITVRLRSEVRELHGDKTLEGITMVDADGTSHRASARAMFVFIGADPCTDWLGATLATDDDGFLVTGEALQLTHLDPARDGRDRPPLPLETSRPGVFAAGDVRSGSIKRVASAVGEGAMAVRMIHQYLAALNGDTTGVPRPPTAPRAVPISG
jgi:thioredoxin reductase (NADPH)